jgi:hypothetical protein
MVTATPKDSIARQISSFNSFSFSSFILYNPLF